MFISSKYIFARKVYYDEPLIVLFLIDNNIKATERQNCVASRVRLIKFQLDDNSYSTGTIGLAFMIQNL